MSSLDKKYLGKLLAKMHEYALIRRDIINCSGDALHHAKRAVFSLQRGETAESQTKLKDALVILTALQKKYPKNIADMNDEGAYRAAVEEYVEADLFFQFVTIGKIGVVRGFGVDADSYIAGLCDVPGELYRYAIRAATNHDVFMVKKCADMGDQIVGALLDFDLTSYLRTKFDQAKQAAHKLEQVVYEVSIRS